MRGILEKLHKLMESAGFVHCDTYRKNKITTSVYRSGDNVVVVKIGKAPYSYTCIPFPEDDDDLRITQ